MQYRTDNTQSIWFVLRRFAQALASPIEALRTFMSDVRSDIRMSEREDFDPFMHRTFDPERNRSIFA